MTKKGTSTQKGMRRGSHPAKPSGDKHTDANTPPLDGAYQASTPEDIAADLQQIEDDRGRIRFRQASAINEFNRTGITLYSIWLELKAVEFDQSAHVKCDPKGFSVQPASAPWTDSHLINTHDEQLARIIANRPISLPLRATLKDAVARWVYSQKYSTSKAAREHGRAMLKAITTRRGRATNSPYTPESLAAAYDDLFDYVSGLNSCIKHLRGQPNSKSVDLLKWFPECEEILKIGDWDLVKVLDKRYILPSPYDLATRALSGPTGLQTSRILSLTEGLRERHR